MWLLWVDCNVCRSWSFSVVSDDLVYAEYGGAPSCDAGPHELDYSLVLKGLDFLYRKPGEAPSIKPVSDVWVP